MVTAFGVAHRQTLLHQLVVDVDGALLVDVRLRDWHHVYALLPEVAQHGGVVGPARRVPCQTTHIRLLPVPVEVENHTVDGITATLQRVDDPFGLFLIVIAVF